MIIKKLLVLLLLIPSLSWGEAIYTKWNCNQLNSSNTNCSQSISSDDFSVKKFFKGIVKSGKRTQFKIVKPLIVSAQNAAITKRSQRNISIKPTMI